MKKATVLLLVSAILLLGQSAWAELVIVPSPSVDEDTRARLEQTRKVEAGRAAYDLQLQQDRQREHRARQAVEQPHLDAVKSQERKGRYVDAAERRAPSTPSTTASHADRCSNAIESQIEGTFEGWSGETVFKLTNGQIWQQSSYSYTYHYAYRPEVLIYSAGGGCKMKVDGVSDSISVKRLK